MSTVLAFDYGERFVGVAVGDVETSMANPLTHIEARESAPRLAAIEAMVREWRPGRLVVGLPLSLDGKPHAMTAKAQAFGAELASRFALPVEYCDERLSSAAAEENLRAAGRGGRANKHLVHAEAARIILQDWLDHAKHAA